VFSTIRRDFSQIPKILVIIFFLSLLFLGSGVLCNKLVMGANDGKMPVGMQRSDMLFVLGATTEYGVTHFPVESDFDNRHQALTEHTKFRILADRIPVSLRFLGKGEMPHWSERLLNATPLPIGQEVIASLGDIFLWIGVLLALVNLPVNILWMLWTLGKKAFCGHTET
jgi:hypothetical protein